MGRHRREEQGRYFPSAKDGRLAMVLWGPLIVLIPMLLLSDEEASAWGVVGVLAVYAFVAWIWFGTGYTVTRKELLVKTGPLRWRIQLKEIEHVKETRNWYSSAALTLDRLEIKYARFGTVFISPYEREAFLALIEKRCPQAEIIRKEDA